MANQRVAWPQLQRLSAKIETSCNGGAKRYGEAAMAMAAWRKPACGGAEAAWRRRRPLPCNGSLAAVGMKEAKYNQPSKRNGENNLTTRCRKSEAESGSCSAAKPESAGGQLEKRSECMYGAINGGQLIWRYGLCWRNGRNGSGYNTS
jgi:hypothetical protein